MCKAMEEWAEELREEGEQLGMKKHAEAGCQNVREWGHRVYPQGCWSRKYLSKWRKSTG